MGRPPTTDHGAAVRLIGLLNGGAELGSHVLACHREQIMGGVTWRDPKKTVGRAQGMEAFQLVIDQDGRRACASNSIRRPNSARTARRDGTRLCPVLIADRVEPSA